MCRICSRPLDTPEEIEMGAHKECMDDEASAILWNRDIPPKIDTRNNETLLYEKFSYLM